MIGAAKASYNIEGPILPKPRREDGLRGNLILAPDSIPMGDPYHIRHFADYHLNYQSQTLQSFSEKFVVLWDSDDERGWVLNGTVAFLHTLRASLARDGAKAVGSTCLVKQEMMKDAKEPHSAESAMKVLLNPEHRGLNIFKNKTGYDKVQNRIEDLVHMFEKIIDCQIKVTTTSLSAQKGGSEPIECLEGWDFMDLAARASPLYPREDSIPAADQSWTHVVRALHAVTLFGNGFGDLIEPASVSQLCQYWKQVPKNQHFLAALTSDFSDILAKVHHRIDEPQKLFQNVLQHLPDRFVEPCPCSNHALLRHAELATILQAGSSSKKVYWNRSEKLGAIILGLGTRDAEQELAVHVEESAPSFVDCGDFGQIFESEYAPESSRTQMSIRSVGSTNSRPSPLRRANSPIERVPRRIVDDVITALDIRHPRKPEGRSDFQIAILCALPVEADAVRIFFDHTWHHYGQRYRDKNTYTLGHIAGHNVVLVHIAGMGKLEATVASVSLQNSFTGIKVGLVVGICGGIPFPSLGSPKEVLLGDVIISTDLVQYDLGKQYPTTFVVKDDHHESLSRPHGSIRSFLNKIIGRMAHRELAKQTDLNLQEACKSQDHYNFGYPGLEKDKLYDSSCDHLHQDPTRCNEGVCADGSSVCKDAIKRSCRDVGCGDERLVARERLKKAQETQSDHPTHTDIDSWIHFGVIASGDTVMKSAKDRDEKARQERTILGFEMEGAGAWEEIPTIVIKGVCDYADSHKNNDWHCYAAGTAAACMKALLQEWPVYDGG
jgi:nucleoside phosphorylase